MFMRHLCEPELPNSNTYSDGVPKDTIPRQNILTRIGIMRLLRNKASDDLVYEQMQSTSISV